MEPYTWVMERAAAGDFSTLPPSQRRRIHEYLDTLARHPFQEGHLRYRDNSGAEIRIYFLGEFDLHCRLDHALREIRVGRLELHPPLEES